MTDASSIKKLRETTGAGMLDCKNALVESKGNFDEAVTWLRKKGLAAASKKASRIASEGLVAVKSSGKIASMIELNSETDFDAKNDKFKELAVNICDVAVKGKINDLEKLKTSKLGNNDVSGSITEAIAVIGENINLRRVTTLEISSNGVIASYVHSAVSDGLGKIGVLVAIESDADGEKLLSLGKQIAMHIAATRPEALTSDQVSSEALEKEKQIFAEQARTSGKPENIIEKMIEGRVNKYYEEVVLMNQFFIMDNKLRVSEYLDKFAKENNTKVKILNFVRFTLGEGIEKKEENFAEEVAKIAG